MTSRLSNKGQLPLPKEIRKRSGTELEIEDRDAPETTLDELFGCIGYQGPRRSLEDMEFAIAKGARESR